MQTCTNPPHLGTLENFGNLLGNLYLGTLGTFTWEPWELGTFTWELGNLWEPLLGNLEMRTLQSFTCERWEPCFGDAWEPLLGILGNLYLESWEPLLGNFGNLGNLYLVTLGAFTREPGVAREPLLGNLGDLYLGTLRTFTWEPWEPLLGTLGSSGTFPWEPLLGNVVDVYLGTLRAFVGNLAKLWERLLGNLENLYLKTLGSSGTFTWEPLLGNPAKVGTLGTLYGNLYLGTFRTWEPSKPSLGNLANLGSFTWELWEPLLGNLENLGNLYLGSLGPLARNFGGDHFRSCSGLLRNLHYGWRPQSFCCWGKIELTKQKMHSKSFLAKIRRRTFCNFFKKIIQAIFWSAPFFLLLFL